MRLTICTVLVGTISILISDDVLFSIFSILGFLNEGKNRILEFCCCLYRLTFISFKVQEWDKDHYFKKQLPLNIPLAKSTSAMQNMKDEWILDKFGDIFNWTLNKYQLKFEVMGGGPNKDIHIVNINAEEVKDWNSYYEQFK